MASAIRGVRRVRCPKCLKILPEPVDIPVYACGGCGKILRAKYSFIKENAGSILGNSSALGSGALENSLPPLTETSPFSTEVENGIKEAVTNDQSAQPLPLSNHPLKIESSEIEECSVDDKGSAKRIPKPTIQPEAERNESDLSNVATDHMLEIKEDGNLNIEVEKSRKLGQVGHEGLNVDRRLHSAESTSPDFASNKDTVFHSVRHGNNLESSMRKSRTYGDKVFSGDGGHDHHAQNGATSSPESVVTNTNKAKGENLVVNAITVEVESGIQADDLPTKLLNGSYKPADTSTVSSPSKYKSRKQKDTSLHSENFRSVKNQLEPKIDGSLRFPVKDKVLNEETQDAKRVSSPPELDSLEHVRLEILRKVDELRYEINDLFHVSVEGKSHIGGTREEIRDKHQRFDLVHDQLKTHKQRENFQQQCKFAQIASLLPPGTCLHCLHEGCQKPPKTSQNILCSNGFCRACSNTMPNHSNDKAQKHAQQQEKSDHEEKRKHAKHHCRPALGGAPFVVCYNCMELLQLPLDFLVTRKQFYRLQCGACYKTLKFSFRARNCSALQTSIQETPNEVSHPPSKVDSSNGIILEHGVSHLKDNQQWDPVSYYEEYGLSNGLIYSADIESPLHVSRNSSGSMVLKNGKLHRLMGYGSASQILYQYSNTDEGFESTDPGTPQSRRVSEEGYVRNRMKGKEIYIPQHSVRRNYPNFIKIQDTDESPKRLRTAGGVFSHHGLPRNRYMQ